MKNLPDRVVWPGGCLDFSNGAILMGILNVTPDSFSDGGLYQDSEAAAAHGIEMAQQGAAIIDVGGESTRPGSNPVPVAEQIRRTAPVIKKLSAGTRIPISIDTADPTVARAAIDSGATMINDITALADGKMAELAVEKQVTVILMHMQGNPKTMQQTPHYSDVVENVRGFLGERAQFARNAGILKDRIFLDPGIGFGKTQEHNLMLLNHLDSLCDLGYRVLVGTSRKGFIGKITGKEHASERVFGTAATIAAAIIKGVSIVRVHDVAAMADVAAVTNAIMNAGKHV